MKYTEISKLIASSTCPSLLQVRAHLLNQVLLEFQSGATDFLEQPSNDCLGRRFCGLHGDVFSSAQIRYKRKCYALHIVVLWGRDLEGA